MARRKVKKGKENPLGKCFTRPFPNGRSIGQQTLESFRLFLHAKYMKFNYSPCLSGSVSEQNARENVRNICDYLTGKYDGPFEGNITEAYMKLCENIHRFSDVFVAKNIS